MVRNLQKILLCIICLINIIATTQCDLRYENLSSMGNFTTSHIFLIIWAFITSSYLYIYTKQLFQQYKYLTKRKAMLLCICCITMISSVCLPYLPQQYPIASKWHVRLAIFSSISYVLLFYQFLIYCSYTAYPSAKRHLIFFSYFIMSELSIYFIFHGVSTLMELSFSFIMSIYLYSLRHASSPL